MLHDYGFDSVNGRVVKLAWVEVKPIEVKGFGV
jgi:hypothetical protein